MQCQQLSQSQKSKFLQQITFLTKSLEKVNFMNDEEQKAIINNLHEFMDDTRISSLLKKEYERIHNQLKVGHKPPFSWDLNTRNDLDKDIKQYINLVRLCIEAEGQYIDDLLEKPSNYAKDMLRFWGVEVPFYQSSPRLQYIEDHIKMLKRLVQKPKMMSQVGFQPHIVQPYILHIVKELENLQDL